MDKNELEIVRHSCSHIMAQAVKELWPETKLGIGPAIEDGFYYDFDRQDPFTEDDLRSIEKRMADIIARDEPFVREELSKEKARKKLLAVHETYKTQLLDEITDDNVSLYATGDNFVDLCRGPHVSSTAKIKAFRLLSVAGAYWHGLETNPMLQRIYGTCFDTEEELKEYLTRIEEAKARDHRKLGPALGLFDIYQQEAGAGLVFYHPKGALLRMLIEDYERAEHIKRGYLPVITPHIMQADLWRTSGHYDYYKENMYIFSEDDKEFVLKPMNCPGHMLIYKSKMRSYRELPVRLFELGTVYRREKAGVLHGLLRVRGFTQDDAHIFCTPEQVGDEISAVIDFVFDAMKVFGFDQLDIELSTRPAKFIGSQEEWQKATDSLKTALEKRGLTYDINEGEGAFYGPKIDIKIKDALNRKWQCATVQCDFALPRRFGLSFIDSQGAKKEPVMLHRVILGSLERFMGALIEQYAGAFPLWLSPVQTVIIPIKVSHSAYARQRMQELKDASIRAEIDERNETLDKRIRAAELEKIPYILVVGERELKAAAVSVRKRGRGDVGSMPFELFLSQIREENKQKN